MASKTGGGTNKGSKGTQATQQKPGKSRFFFGEKMNPDNGCRQRDPITVG